MIIKLNHQELEQMIMEAVKRVEERISPTEVFAGLIWHYCINAQDHFYKGEYYDLPVSFQYDNDGVNNFAPRYHRLQAHIAYRPSGFEVDGRYLLCLCRLKAANERTREAKRKEERKENTPYKTTPREESDSPITFHTHHAVIQATAISTPKDPRPRRDRRNRGANREQTAKSVLNMKVKSRPP